MPFNQHNPVRLYRLPLLTALALACTACTTTEGDVASSGRECRTTQSVGSKMRSSVCKSVDEWAEIDALASEQSADTSDFLRRADEYNRQNPSSPGDRYDPFPAGY